MGTYRVLIQNPNFYFFVPPPLIYIANKSSFGTFPGGGGVGGVNQKYS